MAVEEAKHKRSQSTLSCFPSTRHRDKERAPALAENQEIGAWLKGAGRGVEKRASYLMSALLFLRRKLPKETG